MLNLLIFFIIYKCRNSSFNWLSLTIKLRIIPIAIITFIIYHQMSSKEHLNLIYLCKFNQRECLNVIFIFSFFVSKDFLLVTVLIQLFMSGFLTTITFTLMMEMSFNAPTSMQATHYSLLATFEVFGKLLFQPVIAIFTDYYGYTIAFSLFTCLYMMCAISLKFYPSKKFDSKLIN